jgi:transposase-like protein
MDTTVVNAGVRRARRRHDPEFKRQVIEACQQPGVSVAAIALANGLNANYLRRWVKEHRDQFGRHKISAPVVVAPPSARLVPVTLQAADVAADVATLGEIRLDIRRGQTTVQLAWPVEHAAQLGVILKDLLR